MTAQLSPAPVFRSWDNLGLPLVGGKLFTYAAGTTNPQATYVDSSQTTQNTNPVILNFRGEAFVWLDPSLTYKFALQDIFGNLIWTEDNIPGGFGALPISASLIPNPTNTFSLGNSTHSWTNVYLGPNALPAFDAASGNIGYYARTPPEITAGVTPTNFVYAPGDIRRYGADPTGTADSTTAIQKAISVAQVPAPITNTYATVTIPPGNFLVSSTLNVTGNYVRIQGSEFLASTLYCKTSGIGNVILVNQASAPTFGVKIFDISVFCQPGLASPPNGVNFKDCSECLAERVGGFNCADAFVWNGVNLCRLVAPECGGSSPNTNGLHITINGTTQFFTNTLSQVYDCNFFNCNNAGILFGGACFAIDFYSPYVEECAWGYLFQNDSGSALYDRIALEKPRFWSSSGESFSGGGFLLAKAPAGAGNFLQVRNLVVRDSFINATNGQTYHLQFLQNGNTNVATAYTNIEIENGDYYGNCISVVHSDATTCTGDMRGNINAINAFQSGTVVPLRSGSGTQGTTFATYWGTEEQGNFTPTDASGAALTLATAFGIWSRKGLMVEATFDVQYPATANGSAAVLGGLPYAATTTPHSMFGGFMSLNSLGTAMTALVGTSASTVSLQNAAGGAGILNSAMSGNIVRFTVRYQSV